MSIYYFAYGSNMSVAQMKERVGIVKEPAKGKLPNYCLAFNKMTPKQAGEGKANIMPVKDAVVEGVLYELSEEHLLKLDMNEGCAYKHYRREELKVVRADGTTINAWTYIAYEHRLDNSLKPTKQYLGLLLEGSKYLSDEYYEKLASTETL